MGLRRSRRLGHFRRTACLGMVVAGSMAAVAASGGSSAAQTAAPGGGFNKGLGSATAESIRIDPVAGGLSFGVGIAEALAGHQNTVATAESRAANLGVIGTTMAAEGCDGGDPTLPKEDQPQPLRADSTEEDAAAGKSGQDPKVPGVDRNVRASTDPFAEAITSGGNLEIPGVLSVQGARSTASSGVVNGDTRQAIARSEIGRLILAEGAVELRNLVWEAVHRGGAVDEQTGTFTVGALVVGGTPVPVENPVEALAEANEVLRLVGLEIRPPRVHFDETSKGTLATVDPLSIRVIPSEGRDGVLGPLQSELQPVREELFNALIEADCGNATYITVLDIVLNAFGAGGYFALELGGVQATTNELKLFQGLGALGALPPLPALSPVSGGVLGGTGGRTTAGGGTISGTNTPATDTGAGGEAASGDGGEPSVDDALDAAADGSRGGALAGVGAAGLLLLLATAEGDRRKMRRAMREIPMEA